MNCVCQIRDRAEALAIAAQRAADTGMRQHVWMGPASGAWHVTTTSVPLQVVTEPCS